MVFFLKQVLHFRSASGSATERVRLVPRGPAGAEFAGGAEPEADEGPATVAVAGAEVEAGACWAAGAELDEGTAGAAAGAAVGAAVAGWARGAKLDDEAATEVEAGLADFDRVLRFGLAVPISAGWARGTEPDEETAAATAAEAETGAGAGWADFDRVLRFGLAVLTSSAL